MASVVIIHAAENVAPARALAAKLNSMGLIPIIELPPGDALRQAASEAAAVVGLWSAQSTQDQGILGEAGLAYSAGKLINARMQNTSAPGQFMTSPTIDLTGWRGEDSFPGWRALADAISAKTGVVAAAPRQAAASAPAPGGFFTPGSGPAAAGGASPMQAAPVIPMRPAAAAPPPPQPRPAPPPVNSRLAEPPPIYNPPPDDMPVRSGPNLIVVGILTFVIVAVLGGGGYFMFSRMQSGQAAQSAWATLDQTSPAALRAFLNGPNVGDFRDEAQAALDALEVDRLNAARAQDTIPALERFIRDFPDSRHALEINGRIAELRAAPPAPEPNIDPITGLPIDPNAPALANPPAETPSAPPAPPANEGPVQLTPPDQTLPDNQPDTPGQQLPQ